MKIVCLMSGTFRYNHIGRVGKREKRGQATFFLTANLLMGDPLNSGQTYFISPFLACIDNFSFSVLT